jgi:TolB-like protein/Flp pilus assembly protein TadD
MSSERSFATRLRERKLVQWALAYLAGAWAVLEVSGYVGDQFQWPALVGRALTVLALFGFFIALVLAWYHGEKGRQRVSGPELVMVAALLLAAGVAVSMLRGRTDNGGTEPALTPEPLPFTDERPAVAVLPFVNFSADEDDAYLADGIHEEVLTELAKIGGLRVLSRTSVMRYRSSPEGIRQIGADLGAGFILEATVQRVQNRLRVTAQLIDATRDEHVWAGSFDEGFSLESVLEIRTTLAHAIAAALQTALTPTDQSLVGARHTENRAADEAYFLGRYYQHRPHYTSEDLVRAQAEFTRAVELDPTFALAWLELANTHARAVFYWTDTSEERRSLARDAAAKAMALDPTSPETQLELGLFHLFMERDTRLALEHIAVAEQGMPNSVEVREARAAAYELQGRFDEAIQEVQAALILSPQDPSLFCSLALHHWMTRRYDLAQAYARQARQRAPDQLWPNIYTITTIWSDRGVTPETEAILETLSPRDPWVIWGKWWQRMAEDRYEDALHGLSDPDFRWIRTKMWARPEPLLEAISYVAMGLHDRATPLFNEARRQLEEAVAADPEDPRYHSSLGLAYAGLGRAREAVREGERAVALLPVSEDAIYGIPYLEDMAAARAMMGDAAGAVRQYEELLTMPSWISYHQLEADPRLDGIRNDPLFRELMERHRPR